MTDEQNMFLFANLLNDSNIPDSNILSNDEKIIMNQQEKYYKMMKEYGHDNNISNTFPKDISSLYPPPTNYRYNFIETNSNETNSSELNSSELNSNETISNEMLESIQSNLVPPSNYNPEPKLEPEYKIDDEKALRQTSDPKYVKPMRKFSYGMLLTYLNNFKNEQFVCSPYSIIYLLYIISQGSYGKTFEQLKNIIGIDKSDIINVLKNIILCDSQCSVANGSFIEHKYPIKDSFKYILSEFSKISEFDSQNKQQIVDMINSFVSRNTNKMIQELINESNITNDTQMLLVNAIYFKADWKILFESKNTKLKQFNQPDNNTRAIDMMCTTEEFNYFKHKDKSIIEIPYKKDLYSFGIILPDDPVIFDMEITEFNNIMNDISHCRKQNVKLEMPKFEIETSNDKLIDMMKSFGVTDLFDANLSDLTGITPDDTLYVSNIIQKAKIIVDEKGTEAAAATIVTMNCESFIIDEPVKFVCDHHFVYYIRNRKTHAITFMGYYC